MKLRKQKNNNGYKYSLLLLLSVCFSILGFGQVAVPALKLGDPAPALNATWLKGGPPAKFGDGKVHVVEFWATWCGPCRLNMPHLSKLAQKYRDQASVTSISIWELSHIRNKDYVDFQAKARSFAEHANDMMDYTVGVDDSLNTIADAWMTASRVMGIPYSFVVDQEGKVVWRGTPFSGLDKVVGLVIAHQFNADAAAKIQSEYEANVARYRNLTKESEEAIKSGGNQKAVASAEEAIKLMPEFDDSAISLKYQALDRINREQARAYAHEIIESHKNAPILLISELGRSIMEDKRRKPDYELALELIQAGMRCVDPSEGSQLSMLAKVYYKLKDYDKAIEIQEKAYAYIKDPDREKPLFDIMEARDALALYKTRKQK